MNAVRSVEEDECTGRLELTVTGRFEVHDTFRLKRPEPRKRPGLAEAATDARGGQGGILSNSTAD